MGGVGFEEFADSSPPISRLSAQRLRWMMRGLMAVIVFDRDNRMDAKQYADEIMDPTIAEILVRGAGLSSPVSPLSN